jgi:hypothetical protein
MLRTQIARHDNDRVGKVDAVSLALWVAGINVGKMKNHVRGAKTK